MVRAQWYCKVEGYLGVCTKAGRRLLRTKLTRGLLVHVQSLAKKPNIIIVTLIDFLK